MRFVTVTHAEVGDARVPESTVPHLPDGWTLVADDVEPAAVPRDVALTGDQLADPTPDPPIPAEPATPTKRATRARASRKES